MPFASILQSSTQEQDLVKVEVQREPLTSASPKAGIVQVGLMLEELPNSCRALLVRSASALMHAGCNRCLAEML